MKKNETAEEFIARLKAMPDLDLTDKKVVAEFKQRMKEKIWPEIRKQEILHARSAGRAFTKWVK